MLEITIPDFDLSLTAASGQCFRFTEIDTNKYYLVAGKRQLVIQQKNKDSFLFDCSKEDYKDFWKNYFDLETDYQEFQKNIPKSHDYLYQASIFAKGLRILRQEPFETIISFIISQRKTIPAIKNCIQRLSERFGKPLSGGEYAFPTADVLANASEKELAECGVGYRAKYIQKSSEMIASGQVDLQRNYHNNYSDAKSLLMKLPGVGEKVANCITLFAYHYMDSFPIDVWIQKVLDQEFPEGFPVHLFPGCAGVIQQYLFCYARHMAGK